jgi:hypothetical protein
MAECTERERAFLDAAMRMDKNAMELKQLVLAERLAALDPELVEAAIRVRVEEMSAHKRSAAIWERLNAFGFVGRDIDVIWDKVEAAAMARLEKA